MARAVDDICCYNLLGLIRTATPADVRRAYRQRALETHPDKGGNAENFRRVVIAFETLVNERRRKEYDDLLTRCKSTDGSGTAPESTYAHAAGKGASATPGHTDLLSMQRTVPQAKCRAAKPASKVSATAGHKRGSDSAPGSSASARCKLLSLFGSVGDNGDDEFDASQFLETLLAQRQQDWHEALHSRSHAHLQKLHIKANELLAKMGAATYACKRRKKDSTLPLKLNKIGTSLDSDGVYSDLPPSSPSVTELQGSSNPALCEGQTNIPPHNQDCGTDQTSNQFVSEIMADADACPSHSKKPGIPVAPAQKESHYSRAWAGNRALIRGIISTAYKSITSYVAMIGFKNLIVYSQRTRSLDTAISFHIALTELKDRVEREQEDVSLAPSLETSIRAAVQWVSEERCVADSQTPHPHLCLRFKVGQSISGIYRHTGITRDVNVALAQRQSLLQSRLDGPQKAKELYAELMRTHKKMQLQCREEARNEKAAMLRKEVARRQEERRVARAAQKIKIQEDRARRSKLCLLVAKLDKILTTPQPKKKPAKAKTALERLLRRERFMSLPPGLVFVEVESEGGPGFQAACHGLVGPIRDYVSEAQADSDSLLAAFTSGGMETMRDRLCALEIEHFSQTETLPWM